MTILRRMTNLAAVVVLTLAAGCGGPATGTITGTVTCDGTPLDGGIISFVPASGNSVAATIQPNGAYSVSDVPPGEAVVVITHGPSLAEQGKTLKEGRSKAPPPAKSPITEKYGDANKPQLRFTVQVGANTYSPALTK
jgi:hypothetical protein